MIPSKEDNPKGLHSRYHIQKIKGKEFHRYDDNLQPTYRTVLEDVDPNAEYFVMRLDDGGKDKKHIDACRKAVLYYAELIKDHLPELSQDLIKRYKIEAE